MSYRQWVLEDDFIHGRPPLESVGVQFVRHVEPYEALKVRMLNSSHSALAYAAYLMGYREVHVAMKDPLLSTFIQKYMDDDITPNIPAVPGVDVEQYKTKMRTFMIPAIEDQVASGGSIRWMSFALAAWLRYLRGADKEGERIQIDDPLREHLPQQMARGDGGKSILGMKEIFGEAFSKSPRLGESVLAALEQIERLGTREALRQGLSAPS